jgi:acetylornithine aminotransferase
MVTQAIAEVMNVGDHGSTFAGNPLVCHAAEAVVDIITEEGFLEDVTRKGEKLRAGLEKALGSNPHVKQVRGLGLIVGVQLDVVSISAAGIICTLEVQRSGQMTL